MIKLTVKSGKYKYDLWVNPRHIITIIPRKYDSLVTILDMGERITVSESAELIVDMIETKTQ